MIIHANNLAALLGDERAISSDFQTIQALVSGQIGTMMGFFIFLVIEMKVDYQKMVLMIELVLLFINHLWVLRLVCQPQRKLTILQEKTSFLVTAKLSMGSVAIDTDGIVDVVLQS